MAQNTPAPFRLLDLPLELRQIIYFHAVVDADYLVPRDNRPSLPGLQYRCNGRPKLYHAATAKGELSKRSWYRTFTINYLVVRPIANIEFGFGLFFTSRQVYNEAAQVLYGSHHFAFRDRFSLHTFLMKTNPSNLDLVQSITMDFVRTLGRYSNEVQDNNKDWELSMAIVYAGPRLSETISTLQAKCPKLRYLELRPTNRYIAIEDKEEFESKPFATWDLVQRLSLLELDQISMLIPLSGHGDGRWRDVENHVKSILTGKSIEL